MEEVQAVRLTWTDGTVPSETWSLRYLGEQTNGLAADAAAADVRDALMSLHDGHGTFLLGPLVVSRHSLSSDNCFVYSVTFKDDSSGCTGTGGKNNGDIQILPVGARGPARATK